MAAARIVFATLVAYRAFRTVPAASPVYCLAGMLLVYKTVLIRCCGINREFDRLEENWTGCYRAPFSDAYIRVGTAGVRSVSPLYAAVPGDRQEEKR